jgi:putative nucleotidyltransferase with HDIG domain
MQPHLPVVMVTAIHDISVAIDSMRRGAYDYLLKPFEREHLVSTVQRALDHRQVLQESQNYQQNLEQVVRARTELLRQAMEDLENSYDVTLEALGDALDLKDSETEGHSKRVTAYTIALARAMGISPGQIKIIARGAFLHDIGKMAIPDEILRKPGSLTPEEQEVMREHCTRGYHILRKIPFLSEAAEIVYSHQEHYDGSGYPAGISGNQIPIGARIFAVADTLDAITSDRPYRKARSFDVAREEILRCSGTQFDPAVVEVFLKIPNELWQELRSEITAQNKRFPTFDMANGGAPPAR